MKRVLIIPWFASKTKHVEKYTSFYKNLNCRTDVVNYTIPEATTFTKWKQIRSGKILNNIDTTYDAVHCFSGGNLVLYNLCKRELNYDKIIFDSSPMFPTPQLTSNYISVYFNIKYGTKITENLIEQYWKYEGYEWKQELNNFNDWLKNNQGLCILNDKDPLLDMNSINNWIEKSGSELVKMNGEHVKLYSENEEEYSKIVKEFLL